MGALSQFVQMIWNMGKEKLLSGLRILAGSGKGLPIGAPDGKLVAGIVDRDPPNTAPWAGKTKPRHSSKHIGRHADR